MRMDLYVKSVLTVIALALVVIALNPWVQYVAVPSAEAQPAQYEHTLPKSWGKVVGFSNGNVLLEASDGTLRDVDVRGKSPEYPKVKAAVRWN